MLTNNQFAVQMLSGKALGCADVGEGCGLFTRCCVCSLCDGKLTWGVCQHGKGQCNYTHIMILGCFDNLQSVGDGVISNI